MFSNPGQGVAENAAESPRRPIKMSGHDHPPFFSTWRKAYAFALVLFALEVAVLYAFTLRFS
jgi:hypothetical protein